ncbi:MAG: hypothetical protein CM1200mP41_16780 [Gammaproteobacteria bacterium]|nr:MAG: hypothetical protein CM1200mP41_16780 [Gammaproteobacteria bacterium]
MHNGPTGTGFYFGDMMVDPDARAAIVMKLLCVVSLQSF